MLIVELQEYRQRLLARFAGLVGDLELTVQQISSSAWHLPIDGTNWTAHQIMAHLRDTEKLAFLPRLARILAEDLPAWERFDRSTWVENYYRPEEPMPEILADYGDLRAHELARLKNLPPEAWSRLARHPSWGMRTLQWLVEHGLAYSEEHLRYLRSHQARRINGS